MTACNEFITLRPAGATPMLVDAPAGSEVIVRRGRVWLTQYGDARDVVLGAGQSFTLSFASGALVSGSDDAELIVCRDAAGRSAPATRGGLLRRLAGFFDPRWGSRAARAIAERGHLHRPV